MKLRNLLLVFFGLVLFFSLDATAQRENTFYVKSYASRVNRTVGQMVTAAQASCDANTAIPCVLIFDPTLSVFGAGTLPAKCAQCVWVDYSGAFGGVSPNDADLFNVKKYGAKGDGVTDDTAAIQKAIDASQALAFVGASTGAPVVFFPAGAYAISAPLTPKSARLLGADISTTRLVWNGAAGSTVFTKTLTYSGGCSFGGWERMSFRAGTNKPKTWIEFTCSVDFGMRLRDLQLMQTSGDAILLSAGWVNVHWEHLRFDGIGGFLVNAKVGASQSGSTFNLDGFTSDSSGAPGDVLGGFQVDVTAGGPDAGVFAVSNGRMEYNTNKLLQGLFNWKADATHTGVVEFHGSNLTYADAAGSSATSCLLYVDRNGSGSPRLVAENLKFVNPLGAIFNGSAGWSYWSTSAASLPTSGTIAYASFGSAQDQAQFWGTEGAGSVGFDNTSYSWRSRYRGDSGLRFQMMADGKMSWCNGTSCDVNFYRGSNTTLKTDYAINAVNGFAPGTGDAVTWFKKANHASLDLASVATGACTAETTETITGAALGDACLVSAATALQAGAFFRCAATATDTVKWQLCNLSGGAIDRSSDTYTVRVLR